MLHSPPPSLRFIHVAFLRYTNGLGVVDVVDVVVVISLVVEVRLFPDSTCVSLLVFGVSCFVLFVLTLVLFSFSGLFSGSWLLTVLFVSVVVVLLLLSTGGVTVLFLFSAVVFPEPELLLSTVLLGEPVRTLSIVWFTDPELLLTIGLLSELLLVSTNWFTWLFISPGGFSGLLLSNVWLGDPELLLSTIWDSPDNKLLSVTMFPKYSIVFYSIMIYLNFSSTFPAMMAKAHTQQNS